LRGIPRQSVTEQYQFPYCHAMMKDCHTRISQDCQSAPVHAVRAFETRKFVSGVHNTPPDFHTYTGFLSHNWLLLARFSCDLTWYMLSLLRSEAPWIGLLVHHCRHLTPSITGSLFADLGCPLQILCQQAFSMTMTWYIHMVSTMVYTTHSAPSSDRYVIFSL